MKERLQKLMARAGVASRRQAEQLILGGAVTVNGKAVTELGTKADPERDAVKVNGKLLRFPEKRIYLVLNKPSECVSTMSDPEGRATLRDFLHGAGGRVFPVGRLDYHAEGLVLLTNDGEFANRLLIASKRLPQTFWIKVKGPLREAEIQEVRESADARLTPLARKGTGANPWYEATFTEVKRDLLRQTLARLGHPVEKMRRVKLGSLVLGEVPAGKYRLVSSEEIFQLGGSLERLGRRETGTGGKRKQGNPGWRKNSARWAGSK